LQEQRKTSEDLCKRKKREEKEIEMYRDMIGERW
jgi:hypothetical protein